MKSERETTKEFSELKTPWLPYPRCLKKPGVDIYSEYNSDIELQDYYVSQAKELYQFVQNKSLKSEYDFIFLATGAAMDDFYVQSTQFPHAMERIKRLGPKIQETWWRLMFPYQLETFYKNNSDSKILILIIAPDKHFNVNNPYYSEPQFLKHFSQYKWHNIKANAWNSKKNNIEVRLFNCPMIGYNIEQNFKIEQQKKNMVEENEIIFEKLERLKNTETDAQFVQKFYDNLDHLFSLTEKKDGLVMCINGAVINQRDPRSRYGNYYFIQNLVPLFNKDTPKRLLGSWIYTDSLSYYCLDLKYFPFGVPDTSFIKPSEDQKGQIYYVLPFKSETRKWQIHYLDNLIENDITKDITKEEKHKEKKYFSDLLEYEFYQRL